MAMPVSAPLSTSVTLFGPLPLAISDDTSVAAGATVTSSRKTCRELLLSCSVKASASELPFPTTVKVSWI